MAVPEMQYFAEEEDKTKTPLGRLDGEGKKKRDKFMILQDKEN